MIQAMYNAVSGLRAHKQEMDVIANNIANVNTVGYKASRVNFQDILSQSMRGATAPTVALGGIDPAQVGLGVTVAGIDILHTQGNLQSTGKLTDMAIQGDGFFMLADGKSIVYSRDGAFSISLDGTLVNPASGLKVQGWNADANGQVDPTAATTNIVIPVGRRTTAQATATMAVRGNLDAGAQVGDTAATTLTVYDSLGVQHSCIVTYTKTATNQWSWSASMGTDSAASTSSTGTISFTSDGQFSAADGSLSIAFSNGATTPMTLDTAASPATLGMTTMTQFSGSSEVTSNGDGFTSGTLITFSVGAGGLITGVFSNGQTVALGQIGMATFLNPGGMMRVGQNDYQESASSGNAAVGLPSTGGRGKIVTGALEMSNVDLATQFTSMITAQRGFQANSRSITTSDEMLQELVNLKR
jgi:flagellar hook protein FlgE